MKKLILFFSFLISCNISLAVEHRSKIGIIDTGLNYNQYIHQKYLCKSGHKSFVPNKSWKTDISMNHGTNIFSLVTKNLDHKKYCVIVYKFYSKTATGNQNLYRTLQALIAAKHEKVAYLNMSLYGYEADKDEERLIRDILRQGTQVFVAAGNKREKLDIGTKMCDTYPACYAFPKYRGKSFHVVGNSTHSSTNYGSAITIYKDGTNKGIPRLTGTSQSTPIALNNHITRRKK